MLSDQTSPHHTCNHTNNFINPNTMIDSFYWSPDDTFPFHRSTLHDDEQRVGSGDHTRTWSSLRQAWDIEINIIHSGVLGTVPKKMEKKMFFFNYQILSDTEAGRFNSNYQIWIFVIFLEASLIEIIVLLLNVWHVAASLTDSSLSRHPLPLTVGAGVNPSTREHQPEYIQRIWNYVDNIYLHHSQ